MINSGSFSWDSRFGGGLRHQSGNLPGDEPPVDRWRKTKKCCLLTFQVTNSEKVRVLTI